MRGKAQVKTLPIHTMPVEFPIAFLHDELEVDQAKLVRVGDRRIVLARAEQGYAAFDDRCSQRGGRCPTAC